MSLSVAGLVRNQNSGLVNFSHNRTSAKRSSPEEKLELEDYRRTQKVVGRDFVSVSVRFFFFAREDTRVKCLRCET